MKKILLYIFAVAFVGGLLADEESYIESFDSADGLVKTAIIRANNLAQLAINRHEVALYEQMAIELEEVDEKFNYLENSLKKHGYTKNFSEEALKILKNIQDHLRVISTMNREEVLATRINSIDTHVDQAAITIANDFNFKSKL